MTTTSCEVAYIDGLLEGIFRNRPDPIPHAVYRVNFQAIRGLSLEWGIGTNSTADLQRVPRSRASQRGTLSLNVTITPWRPVTDLQKYPCIRAQPIRLSSTH